MIRFSKFIPYKNIKNYAMIIGRSIELRATITNRVFSFSEIVNFSNKHLHMGVTIGPISLSFIVSKNIGDCWK